MRRRSMIAAGVAVRGLALFLAAFTIVGLIGEARGRATDVGLWFVDLRDVARPVQVGLLGVLGGALLAWLLADRPATFQRRATAVVCFLFAAFAVRDVVRFEQVVASGLVRPALPIPLSLPIAVVLALGGLWIWRDRGLERVGAGRTRIAVASLAVVTALAFPIVQIGFFGTTDYRRPADAAVVLGARVYADGAPSPLLADRIATGVELYRAGLVPRLVMSGGDGADGFNEAVV
ncbi:MAG TPA: ElyC/SanA/YdcF family protein, partial [Candidatus Deferrimicrobium sp.]|nr:ElyC/SanA/YdcF family protein [Candidatus Deferrimicrobium sp.]